MTINEDTNLNNTTEFESSEWRRKQKGRKITDPTVQEGQDFAKRVYYLNCQECSSENIEILEHKILWLKKNDTQIITQLE